MFLSFFCRPLVVVASCITCYGISLGPFAVYADEHDRVIQYTQARKQNLKMTVFSWTTLRLVLF
jgi:hypothetical protein